ncbi:hypothetical protein HMN09_00263400 [Mycena chlorophos]|uniref:Uncharacterized protein n=1 Tax=Mycena chlorophos TaxID=658473 RepID=A0A8H6WHW2_MYCCL|nr:hypothetical protein HMN09_00263400 [Mycena chlorophos]
MGSLCFSSAAILRCDSFTTLESQLLIIPTALELLFATAVIFTNWGTSRRHLLLTAEGWTYFGLALVELLSHTLPAVRDSVTVFSVVDTVLGATSFLPILFYTLFLFLFTRAELVDTLPTRYQGLASALLGIFIPAIIALVELSSFIGISRRTLVINGKPQVAIGFPAPSDQQLWTFLTSIALALLTAYQAINFFFAFYRLVRAFMDQRRIETTSTDQAHPIRGIGWVSAGIKLGAIETVIGYAQGGFGGALTRRILRFVARALLAIGVIKGPDRMDDFTEITRELDASRRPAVRRSRLANLISNPRFSTFQQLTPTATTFYNAPRARPKSSILRQPTPEKQPEMAQFSQLRETTLARPVSLARTATVGSQYTQDSQGHLRPRERVTVHYGSGAAPTLSMRFSGLDMPSPAVIAESVKSRPVSAGWVSIARSSHYAPSGIEPSFAFDAPPVPVSYPEFIYDRGIPPSQPVTPESKAHTRAYSEFSTRSSVHSAVRDLADQFPGTPMQQPPMPLMPPPAVRSEWHDDAESQRNSRRSYDEIQRPRDSGVYVGGVVSSPEEEAVYQYTYDGNLSSPEQHPYAYSPPVVNPASPPRRHHTTQSDTTLGTSPLKSGAGLAYLSPFSEPIVDTPETEMSNVDPFQYDNNANKQQGVMQPVYMGDGPRNGGVPYERDSAALLQMTQRERDDIDWAPAEFTPSLLVSTPSTKSNASSRHTLKKRRKPTTNTTTMVAAASANTLASSWLQHDPAEDAERYADADADYEPAPVERESVQIGPPARVKSVGRQRAPQKATPVPVNARHGLARGSIYIQPIHVPPQAFHSEVQIVQGSSSAESSQSEFREITGAGRV